MALWSGADQGEELVEGGDLVCDVVVRCGDPAMGVVPAGGDAIVRAATDVGGEAVSDHDRGLLVWVAEALEGDVEDGRAGLC